MPMIANPSSAERSAQHKTRDSSRPPHSSDPASIAADKSASANAEPCNGSNSRVRSHEAVQLQRVPVSRLKPHSRNARTHSKKQIRQIAASIQAFGFTAPILVDEDLMILAGHGRVEAAKLLGLVEVPVVQLIGRHCHVN